MAYLWQRRVATGIDLLANTGLPVGDIAARAGFKSVYHFSRRVKEQTGVPPTQVRRERWINPRNGLKSTLRAPHTGQYQSSGMSVNAVPGGMPPSGSPSAGS